MMSVLLYASGWLLPSLRARLQRDSEATDRPDVHSVTVMSVLLYASVVRIVVWDECSQSLLVGKLCRIGMA